MHERIVVGRISRLLSLKHRGQPLAWLEVCLAQHVPDRHPLFIGFKLSEARYYVPLGWGGWTVARRISLPIDFINSQYRIYNYRMLWLMADQWPPGREGVASIGDDAEEDDALDV